MSFESSWADAEAVVMQALCTATASTEKKNAFRGYLPPMVNVWALFTGGDGGNAQTTWTPDITSLHFAARIEGQFAEREGALIWAMQVIKALPITGVECVQSFRVKSEGMPEPVPAVIPIGNSESEAGVYIVQFDCDFVFSTGGRL